MALTHTQGCFAQTITQPYSAFQRPNLHFPLPKPAGQVPLASAYLTLLCWTSLVGGQTIVGTNEPIYEHTIILTRGPTGRCPCHQRKAHSSHSQYSLSYDKNGVLRPLCAANYNLFAICMSCIHATPYSVGFSSRQNDIG